MSPRCKFTVSRRKIKNPIILVALTAHKTPTLQPCNGASRIKMQFSAHQHLLFWEFSYPLTWNQTASPNKCGAHFSIRNPKSWELLYGVSLFPCTAVTAAFLDAFAELREATFSFVMFVCSSVRPHGPTRLQMDGFSRKLVFQYFSKVCQRNSSFIKI